MNKYLKHQNIIEIEKDKLPEGIKDGTILIYEDEEYKLDLNEENLNVIEESYHIEIVHRQDELVFMNCDEQVYRSITRLIHTLLVLCQEGRSFSSGDVLYAISLEKQNQLDELTGFYHHSIAKTISGKVIYPKTIGQMAYLKALKKLKSKIDNTFDNTFAVDY